MNKNTLKKSQDYDIRIPMGSVPLEPDMAVCQDDYPLDRYQQAFVPYAREYLALPDRRPETVLPWLASYIEPAKAHFGDSLLLLAHYYMGGEIVNCIEHFGGEVGDSYQLALKAAQHPEKSVIVECAVHFMAESIAILAGSHQRVYITNPKSGCTMEMNAQDDMVEPAFDTLNARYGAENIVPVCYMNTGGRLKALTGAQGGAVCTSSNVKPIFAWALAQHKKIFFMPDRYMGENAARWSGVAEDEIAYWPGGNEGAQFDLEAQDEETLRRFDQARVIIFSSFCAVHSYLRASMVEYWQRRGYNVVVHPECRYETVSAADATGSTAFIQDYVDHDRGRRPGKKYAIGTENHMVKNLRRKLAKQGYDIVHVGDADLTGFHGMGCGCATMSRNDPPHLAATLDLLRRGEILDYNLVRPGDMVNEFTGQRRRLAASEQRCLAEQAKRAMDNMIEITEAAR